MPLRIPWYQEENKLLKVFQMMCWFKSMPVCFFNLWDISFIQNHFYKLLSPIFQKEYGINYTSYSTLECLSRRVSSFLPEFFRSAFLITFFKGLWFSSKNRLAKNLDMNTYFMLWKNSLWWLRLTRCFPL